MVLRQGLMLMVLKKPSAIAMHVAIKIKLLQGALLKDELSSAP
jgi:hypothetical protein